MPKLEPDALFYLIKSLTKSEKRHFKLYAKRTNAERDAKFIQLFDPLDQLKEYDDKTVMERAVGIKPSQLSNTKAHLYRQILKSLRLLEINQNADIEIREHIDYARVLYNKGLYRQSLKTLERIKQKAVEHHEDTLHLEIVDFEKLIESQYITHSMENRAELLTREATNLTEVIHRTQVLSNLSLSLYGLYLKLGSVRNESDYQVVNRFFYRHMPEYGLKDLSVNERLYLYQSMVWFHYIVQDFVKCYRYAQAWVDLFHTNPELKTAKPDLYVKGLHNLLAALFNIQYYEKFTVVLKELESFEAQSNENLEILVFLYTYHNKINLHFMEGRFTEGLSLIPPIEAKMEELEGKLDHHRILLFYYKIACLYFGSGDNQSAANYLNKIINFKDVNLREDIHCFARILNIIAHYELGNNDLLEYQIKSTYRFLVKMDNLQKVQKEIIKWLRKTPRMVESDVRGEFITLKGKLEEIVTEPFELRPYLYLDIISWLESKIENVPVQEIIRRKFVN
ncbi:MAG: hypothetical protein AAGC88_12750, partial [Bacteroidota bacterium]